MRTLLLIATPFAAAVVLISALAKLRHDAHVVDVVHNTVGVPLRYFPLLAGAEIAGAIGIIAGLWWAPVGIAAGVGLVVYFVGAVVGHLRVRDVGGIGAAVFVLTLVSVALVARLVTI